MVAPGVAPDTDPTEGGRLCGAEKRQGPGTCRRPAGWGTSHPGVGCCKLHFGSTANHRVHAEAVTLRRTIADELADVGNGNPDNIAGLAEEVRFSDAMCHALRRLVAKLPSEPTAGTPGIYGPDHLGDLRAHPLMPMLGEWSDRHARQRKMAIDAGIAERELEYNTAAVRQVADMLRQVLAAALALMLRLAEAGSVSPAEVRRAWEAEMPVIVRSQLSALAAGEGE